MNKESNNKKAKLKEGINLNILILVYVYYRAYGTIDDNWTWTILFSRPEYVVFMLVFNICS